MDRFIEKSRLGNAWARAPAIRIERGKGHVSVNPVYGCGVGCPYCVCRVDPWYSGEAEAGGGGVPIAPVDRILDALTRNAAALAPLRLSVLDFCEPFARPNLPHLRALLMGIEARLPGQAVLVTTRVHPGEELLDWLAGFDKLRLSVFVSMGDATGRVPPVTPVRPRLKLMADCSSRGLHTVTLLKPLVAEWTSYGVLSTLLRHAARTCDEVVVGGLIGSPAVEAALREARWPVPAEASTGRGVVEPALLMRVLTLAAELPGGKPISEHRSCAINRRRSLPCLVASAEAQLAANDDAALDLSPVQCPGASGRGHAAPAAEAGQVRCLPRAERVRCLPVAEHRGRRKDEGRDPAPIVQCKSCVGGGGGASESRTVRDSGGYCRLKAA